MYAQTLKNLGLEEEAKSYLDFIKKSDSINGFKYVYFKNEEGETVKIKTPQK
ncbi:hypothetical protein [Hyunsoonleella pacifica]|uniref:hypothetical protein n=1 Tax=Hyunsoonleella pacifica TaxID=1080224 RepID=UPI0013EF12F1|nr:hypothetical protein [Hyunsoonleella pacifica]GGD12872.1 hypothetical protein GCM10011368_13550 [Hyunsoonleella pacifica]